MSMDILSIPALSAGPVHLHLLPVGQHNDADVFLNPQRWTIRQLQQQGGWWSIDLATLGLADGDYEYGFAREQPAQMLDDLIPDPFADEIVRLGGYRGILHMRGGHRWSAPFVWDGELPPGVSLPNNNKIVIYELPIRWISGAEEDPQNLRQIGLGTFDRLLFEMLTYVADLGVNAVELLPVQDSADTLNWGYGTRFFFAPDFDMGAPVDLKLFIKRCHTLGIRVIMDIVMNHARACPLETLAADWYFLREGGQAEYLQQDAAEREDRNTWGGRLFRYATPVATGGAPSFLARDFHYRMASHWITNYHIDGFRLDEFKSIKNYDFLQGFRDNAWRTVDDTPELQGRPFLVIAEDTRRQPDITQPGARGYNGRPVSDAMWNFSFRDDARRLLSNTLWTALGSPSRTERVRAMVRSDRIWDGLREGGGLFPGFTDLAQTINYLASHDVEKEDEQRLMTSFFRRWLREWGISDGSFGDIRAFVESETAQGQVGAARLRALQQIRSGFALLMTCVGIPMFLAGEEFADIQDLDPSVGNLKMGDALNWRRAGLAGHHELTIAVRDLIALRTAHAALHRNEVELFHFHPTFDANDGERVFAYSRTNGHDLGAAGVQQVIVVANCSGRRYDSYDLPFWPWQGAAVTERGAYPGDRHPDWRPQDQVFRLSLAPFQVRVFTA